MNDALKWVGKVLLQGVLWVFILSIRWNGHATIYSSASEVLVQNTLVQTIDQELADLWSRASQAARLTFNKAREDDKSL